MKKFKQFCEELEHLEEGVNDPAIFKAVFLAGGPGSGKSFISKLFGYQVFNADDEVKFIYKKTKSVSIN